MQKRGQFCLTIYKRAPYIAYVMTDEYKKRDNEPRSGYVEQILRGYRDAMIRRGEMKV